MSKARLLDIDRSKGFAIFLVVVGHILTGATLEGNDWFKFLHSAIYRFHMPFFMFLSGAIFYYTYKNIESVRDYLKFISKKALRLMPGFFLFALIILSGKLIMSKIMYVDDVPTNIWIDLLNIIICPYYGPAGSLWYIYVLFEFYLISPLLLKLSNSKLLWNLFIAFVLHLLSISLNITTFFMLNVFTEYYLYFSIGFLLIRHYNKLREIFTKFFILSVILFVFSFTTTQFLPGQISKLIISLLSIPAIIGLMNNKIIINNLNSTLLLFSEYTFTIYLMNTIVLGLTKGVIFKFISWDGTNFLFILPFLIFLGLTIPILVHKFIFSRIDFLSRMTK